MKKEYRLKPQDYTRLHREKKIILSADSERSLKLKGIKIFQDNENNKKIMPTRFYPIITRLRKTKIILQKQ